jgi:hypothetical protein
MTYNGLETFWAGLSFILSPYAALLAGNAEIGYFGIDWSMWYLRTTKTVVWRVVKCATSFEVAPKGEIRQESSKQDETKEAEMKTRDVTRDMSHINMHKHRSNVRKAARCAQLAAHFCIQINCEPKYIKKKMYLSLG